jgi:hypothetical protein
MLGIGFYPDLTLQLWNQKAQELVFLSSGNEKSIRLISYSYPLEKENSFNQ